MLSEAGFRNKFRKIYDFKAYYYKTKAPKPSDNEINFYNFHQLAHPIVDYFNKDIAKIEVLHGLIWLALSGYAKDDIDSVIGSFYLGLYYLEQGLKKA